MTDGNLRADREPTDVKFEGINGESKSSYKVRYPVRIQGHDGYVQASVIPGKAPFLLSIQALRQMRAKLDCEHDTLTVPGIGVVHLQVNQVGHYTLPLFDFQSRRESFGKRDNQNEHGLATAEAGADSFAPEGELEDVTNRPASIVSVGVDNVNPQAKTGSPDPRTSGAAESAQPSEAEISQGSNYVPTFESVARRRDSYAKAVWLRLAKETHGPWVSLPRELPALHLILGKYGFTESDDNASAPSARHPWQVRAAQLGYRSRVVRRAPLKLQGSWVLVLSLEDSHVTVVKQWTLESECAGKPIECAGARMFLFVFAYPPGAVRVPETPNMSMTARVPGNRRDLRTVFYLKDKTSREFRHTAAKVYQLPPRGSDFRIGDVNKRVTFCAVSGELLEEFTFEPHTGHSDRAPEQALMVGRVASLSASCNDSVPVMFEPTPVSAD